MSGAAPEQGGNQFVSKVVTVAISTLLKRAEKLEVNVRVEPVARLMQGNIDGFDFLGRGLAMHSGLRVSLMEFYLQSLSIEFGALFKGHIKLRRPTQASMRIVLSEDDLTTSFNTPFLKDKLQQLTFQDQPLLFEQTQITVNDDQSLRLQSSVRCGQAASLSEVDLTAKIAVEDRRKLQFVDVSYSGDSEAIALGNTLIEHVNNLLDLDQFVLDGMQLKVDRLRIRNKQFTLYGVADLSKFPQKAS
ncbi:MAG: DUF2993 domain-containing protein [Cyanobacteria bacterium P01_F01_bin.42]